MQHYWQKRTTKQKLIVFFSGWGMSANSVNLDSEIADVLVFYDYSDGIILSDEVLGQIKEYQTIFVVAWSLGVVPATYNKDFFNPELMVAVNGSLFPCDDKYGIPFDRYQATHDSLNQANLDKFYKRMFRDKEDYKRFLSVQKLRTICNLKQELLSIRELSAKLSMEQKDLFDKIIISNQDKIFPAENLLAFWDNPSLLEASHFPFYKFEFWEDLLFAK